MKKIKTIFYYYEESAIITYRRRIIPLEKTLKEVVIRPLVKDNFSERADILILQSIPMDKHFVQDILNKKYSEKVVYDRTDDLTSVIYPKFWRKMLWTILTLIRRKKHPSFIHKKFIEQSDLVICGSRIQAETVRQINPNVCYIVDAVPQNEYPLLERGISKEFSDVPIVVWEGTHSSMHQLKVVLQPLLTLQQRNSFEFVILSNIYNEADRKFVEYLKERGVKFKFVEWTMESFKQILSEASIAIAPIDVTKKFNRAKPYNKILTYWAYKLSVVASSIDSYEEIIKHDENGFISKTNKDWENHLSVLIENVNKSKSMADKGFLQALKHTEDKFANNYLKILYDTFS